MKTPISYYGGKQQMLKHILPIIPDHSIYTEPFFGGGAVFFGKEPAKIEVINDTDQVLVEFYRVLKNKPDELNQLVQETLHSRRLYGDAMVVYNNPHLFNDVRKAWAFWVLTQQGFSCGIGSWGYDKSSNSVAKKVQNAKDRFNSLEASRRLENTQVENNDAIKIIKSRDTENTFHYCDPPYFNSDCNHYAGYSLEDFRRLLDTLEAVKGKFLLSSYDSEILQEYCIKNKWYVKKFEKNVSVTHKTKKKKIEVLTANYPI